jgi:hypothetical protein
MGLMVIAFRATVVCRDRGRPIYSELNLFYISCLERAQFPRELF